MPSYLVIVLFRIIEIISRFFFLGLCLSTLSLENYGKLSYETALMQFFATILFSGTLQSLSQLKEQDLNKKGNFLFSLSLVSIVVFIISFSTIGDVSFVFLFYSFLYIQTGWSASSGNQIIFSSIRSFSFLIQTLYIYFSESTHLIQKCYQSYGFATLGLIVYFPWKSLKIGFPSFYDWGYFFKFQVHNLTFQLTKIVERWVMLFLLNEHFFGLYSSIRDLINASNLAFFSPLYQIYYKRLVLGLDYRAMLKKVIFFLLISVIISESLCFAFPELTKSAISYLKLRHFNYTHVMLLIFLCGLDFSRSFLMMIFEARNRFKNLFLSHFLDIGLLTIFLLFKFSEYDDFTIICCILIMRLSFLNIYYTWKKV